MWAHSLLPLDCHPDIVTMAKPLANGFPIGAIMVRDHIAQHITPGRAYVLHLILHGILSITLQVRMERHLVVLSLRPD
jgi:4-aminobutyrate aminotransferase-like enzyme